MELFIVEFDLKTRSPLTVENGDVIVDRGYPTVTVRNVQADSTDDAINKARPKADAFLNELSWQHELNLEIGNGSTVMIQDSPLIRHIKEFYTKVYTKGGHSKKVPRTLKEVVVRSSDSKACIAPAEWLLKQGSLGVRELFKLVRVRYVEADEIDRFDPSHLSFFNINTKSDLARARGLLRERYI